MKCTFCLFMLIAAAVLTVGCWQSKGLHLGEAIPDMPPVKLKTILDSAASFDGKNVVLNGIISGQCPSLCEFTYTEGTLSTLIFPQGFKLPRLQAGKSVTIYARITSGPGQVVVTALGLEIR